MRPLELKASIVALAAVICGQAEAAEKPAAPALAAAPSIAIGNGVLTARVLRPGAASFYQGVRFDHSGMISSLRYGGTEFYGLWFEAIDDGLRDYEFRDGRVVAATNTAAVGPSEVFDALIPGTWATLPAGGHFAKIGVGILRKPADGAAYNQFGRYELVDRAQWKVASTRNSVTFTQQVSDRESGIGFVYRKTIRLPMGKPQMIIEHELRNTGTQPVNTTVYNHNFTSLGRDESRAGLTVSAGFPIKSDRTPASDAAVVEGERLRFLRPLRDSETVSLPISNAAADGATAHLSVTDSRGAAILTTNGLPLSRMMIWSMRRTVAIEPFVAIAAAPGQAIHWSTTYEYRQATAPK